MPKTIYPPPWKKYPYPWGSIGWSMGEGQTYWPTFCHWFRSLDDDARRRFTNDNPEPGNWYRFYDFICTDSDDRARRDKLIRQRDESRGAYCEVEYSAGKQAESDGNFENALQHYFQALQYYRFVKEPSFKKADVEVRHERVRQKYLDSSKQTSGGQQ